MLSRRRALDAIRRSQRLHSSQMFLLRGMCSSSGTPAQGNHSSPEGNPSAGAARKDSLPSSFPPGLPPSRLKSELYNYRYHIFKSPTKSGIFGHRVGPPYTPKIHAPNRLARKLRNAPRSTRESMPASIQSLHSKRRKPNMKSNLLPIGGGSHAPNLALKLLQQIDVSEMARSVLLGSLLGHGNLFVDRQRYPDSAVLFFRNHVKNKAYFDWKAEQFKDYAFEQSSGTRAGKLEFRTAPVPEFKLFHHMTCRRNHTVVKRKWLNHMTPVSLAVWWCDRGNIIARGTKGQLVTDKFDKDSVEMMQQYLKVMWKVETDIATIHRDDRLWGRKRVDKTYYRIYIRTPQLKIFLRIIMRYIPVPEMIRKTVVIHDSVSKQKAWVEEMKSAMPQWSEEIDREVARQKKGRRTVREAARLREWEARNKASLEAGGGGVDRRKFLRRPLRRKWYGAKKGTLDDQAGSGSSGVAEKKIEKVASGVAENKIDKVGNGVTEKIEKARVETKMVVDTGGEKLEGFAFDRPTSRIRKKRKKTKTMAEEMPRVRPKWRGAKITKLFNIFTGKDDQERSETRRGKAAVAA